MEGGGGGFPMGGWGGGVTTKRWAGCELIWGFGVGFRVATAASTATKIETAGVGRGVW